MTTQATRRSIALVAVLVLAAWAAAALVGGDDERPSAVLPGGAGESDPFTYDPGEREEFERRAAAGLSHVLYAKSPGGAIATAERVGRYRELIEEVAGDHDP